jgi:hypothetical protein
MERNEHCLLDHEKHVTSLGSFHGFFLIVSRILLQFYHKCIGSIERNMDHIKDFYVTLALHSLESWQICTQILQMHTFCPFGCAR